MKEEKVRCTRCPAEISVNPEVEVETKHRLGWVDFRTYRWHNGALNNVTLCPHCVHELKRFLAGHAISAVKEVK